MRIPIILIILLIVWGTASRKQKEGIDRVLERRLMREKGLLGPDGEPLPGAIEALHGEDSASFKKTWFQKNRYYLAAAATVLLAGIVLYVSLRDDLHQVALVNALGTTYDVTIDGKTHTLKAGGNPVFLELDSKPRKIRAAFPIPGKSEPFVFEYEIAIPRDAFGAIINPDRIGVFYWEKLAYRNYTPRPSYMPNTGGMDIAKILADNDRLNGLNRAVASASGSAPSPRPSPPPPMPEPAKNPNVTIYANDGVYTVAGPVDYFFTKPERIVAKRLGDDQDRVHVDWFRDTEPDALARVIATYAGRDAAIEYINRRGILRPAEVEQLSQIVASWTSAEADAFYAQHLDDFPVMELWHLCRVLDYETRNPGKTLQAEYAGRLKKHPGDGSLLYIIGRGETDFDARREYFQKSSRSKNPSAFALFAVSYGEMQKGRFAEALAHNEKARALGSGSSFADLKINDLGVQILLALGRLREAGNEAAKLQRMFPGRKEVAMRHVSVLGAQGLPAGYAKDAEDAYFSESRDAKGSHEQLMTDLHELRFAFDYAKNDKIGCQLDLDHLKNMEKYQWIAAICAGACEKAETMHPDAAGITLPALQLYIVAMQNGATEIAGRSLARALGDMAELGAARRTIALAFGSATTMSPEVVWDAWLLPEQKRIILCALGWRHPEHRAYYFEKTRLMNFLPTFPKQQLEESMKAGEKTPDK